MQRGFHEPRDPTLEKWGDAVDQASWESSFLDDPDAKFFCENGDAPIKRKNGQPRKKPRPVETDTTDTTAGVRIKTFFRQRFT